MKKVPELRFPNFDDDWERQELINVANLIMGQSPKSASYNKEKIGLPLIQGNADIKNKYTSPQLFTSEVTKICNYGDIILTVRAPVGEVAKSKHKACIGRGVCAIQPIINSEYLYYFLLKSENNWHKFAQGSTFEAVNSNDIKSFSVIKPSSTLEQQKIGDFFSTLDSRIEVQEEKNKNLEDQKKGYIQKLFSQEIRFKDENGETYPEWKEKKLGEIITHDGGTALEKFVNSEGSHKFISIGNYSKDGRYIDNGQRILLNDKTKEKLLNKDDLVMVLNDKTSSGDIIGSTLLIEKNNQYIYNQRSERIVSKGNISPVFMWFLLNSKKQRTEVFRISQGGTQIYVNFSAIKKLKLSIPSLHEQQKIADFLSSFDEKIEIEKQILEALQEMKKGFLQKMFV